MFGRRYKQLGVLGINSRNLDYIMKMNQREFYPLADDKLKFKALAAESGLNVPALYGAISYVGEAKRAYKLLRKNPSCVIKPAHGSGGEGVLVLEAGSAPGMFRRSNGEEIGFTDVRHHIAKTLHGMYSLGGQPDKAMIEYRVRVNPIFSNIVYKGVPDVRIIVYQGIPVIAMIRLPTRASGGRANLHQGAVAAGINIASGITQSGVQGSSIVTTHPDTHTSIENIQIPQWDTLLTNASRCFDLTQLGYLGVDMVLDEEYGPMILEINARPGLAVQIANMIGLRSRLAKVDCAGSLPTSTEERIALGKSLS